MRFCLSFLFASLMFFLVLASPGQGAIATENEKPQNQLTAEELQAGWILLFDGKTLFGWKQASDADWHIRDGAIRATKGQQGLLHTTSQFSDYELRCDFRAAEDTNSGIFLRTSPKPESPTRGCYELNIASPQESQFPTGSIVGREKGEPVVWDTNWHTYHIIASEGTFLVQFDGKPVITWDDDKPLGRGYIGLQKNKGPIEFRNIKLRPLNMRTLMNGENLAGWTVFPDKASKFSVTSRGELRIQDGPGQLETKGQYGDFVFQGEVFVDGTDLNSGIFFRSIPGDFSNGYESQIHNGFKDGDRTRPSNGGTGGIFRRQSARRVVANDREWFYKTIVCEGSHMAVWVNGYQVSDWTDRRTQDLNPRRGLRREKGTIILQGHDPTTDLLFRNLRVVEMAPRR